jgi:hypothetical protein
MPVISKNKIAGSRKRECEEVPEGYIPLLPLRFALNDDSIINSKYQDYIYPAMPQIDNHEGYIITRLRRGYVYVYYPDETETSRKWEVFRYETIREDANGREGRTDTDELPISPSYSFTKYDLATVEDKVWQFDREKGPTNTIPVRQNQNRLFIAYSEYRWPVIYFKELEQDEDLCFGHMTPVQHDAKNDGQQTSFSELYNISEYFHQTPYDIKGWLENNSSLDANEYAFNGLGPDQYLDINDIRYTDIVPEYIPKSVWGKASYDERSKIVVLRDPVGEQLDLNAYSVFLAGWLEVFIGIRHYPLITGNFIKGIKDEQIRIASKLDKSGKQVDSDTWDSIKIFFQELSLDLEDELTPGFDVVYEGLVSAVSENEAQVAFVILNSKKAISNSENYSSSVNVFRDFSYLDVRFSKYSKVYIGQLADYQAKNYSRLYTGVGNTNIGNQYLNALFNQVLPKRADGKVFTYYDLIDDDFSVSEYIKILKIGEGYFGSLSGAVAYDENIFQGVGKFISTFKSALIQGYINSRDAVCKFVRVMFGKTIILVNYMTEVTNAFLDIHSGGNIILRDQLDKTWKAEAASRSKTGAFKENPYVFEKKFEFQVVKPAVDLNKRAVNNMANVNFEDAFSHATNAFNFFAAALTVVDNLSGMDKDLKGDADFADIMLHPAMQIVGASLDIGAAVIGFQKNKLSLNLKGIFLEELFGNKLSENALKSGINRAGIAIIGSAALATILIAAASVYDSYEKEDTAGIIGNSMWLASPMMISLAMHNLGKERATLTVLGAALPWSWVNILGYILLLAGFIVLLLFQRNELQEWVRNGYWGVNDKILDEEDRPNSIGEITSCYLNYSSAFELERVKYYQSNYFQKDMALFYFLSSYVQIVDDINRDCKIGVASNLIKDEASLDELGFHGYINGKPDSSKGSILPTPIIFLDSYDCYSWEFISEGRAYLSFDKSLLEKLNGEYNYSLPRLYVKISFENESVKKFSDYFSIGLDEL